VVTIVFLSERLIT